MPVAAFTLRGAYEFTLCIFIPICGTYPPLQETFVLRRQLLSYVEVFYFSMRHLADSFQSDFIHNRYNSFCPVWQWVENLSVGT